MSDVGGMELRLRDFKNLLKHIEHIAAEAEKWDQPIRGSDFRVMIDGCKKIFLAEEDWK